MHNWGDKGVDWKAIDAAADYIGHTCRKWGRLGGQTKEKYGTVRFYAIFGGLSLHALLYPDYPYNQFPKWLWALDCRVSRYIPQIFNRIFNWFQRQVYSYAYRQACRKWPHIQTEILCCADYPEFIKGHTRTEGNQRHILDTAGNIVSTWITLK